jgi:hypothetical protein
MVTTAGQGKIIEICRTAVSPVLHVVGITPAIRPITPRKDTTVVPDS